MEQLYRKAELPGGDSYEWAPGRHPALWGARSVYTTGETMLWLQRYLGLAVPHINYYGPTVLYERDWVRVAAAFAADAPAVREHGALFAQLDEFMRAAFFHYAAVTLYGV